MVWGFPVQQGAKERDHSIWKKSLNLEDEVNWDESDGSADGSIDDETNADVFVDVWGSFNAAYADKFQQKHVDQYLGGYTSLGYVTFETLEEAVQSCVKLSFDDCGGITYTPASSAHLQMPGYQPRRANNPKSSSRGEVSYIRPEVNPGPK